MATQGTSHAGRVTELVEDDELVIQVELPGIDPDEDVAVSLADDVLTIKAEHSSTSSEQTDLGYRSEFQFGHFARHLRVPTGTQAHQITATYAGSVLQIRVPRPVPGIGITTIPVTRG